MNTLTQIEDPELLPEPIKALEGKSYCFGIAVSSDNVWDGADTFKVLEVWSGDHVLKVESASEPSSMIGTSSSAMSSEVVSLLFTLYIQCNIYFILYIIEP